MFSYYGSKSKIIDYYPPPKYGVIIEPFAGSARYSLKYWDRDVTLVDKYDVIFKVWNYLKQASTNDILTLPNFSRGEYFNTNGLCQEEILLLGFIAGQGASMPQMKAGTFDGMNVQRTKKHIADNLYKIKHWQILHCDYEDIQNEYATWFIDPPYQYGGHRYKHSNKKIDFDKLSKWCESRNGQVIVCENTKATWMDFKPVISLNGAKHKTIEAIWCNHPTNYDAQQMTMQF
jgi:site-specific DNA-adenine methylase